MATEYTAKLTTIKGQRSVSCKAFGHLNTKYHAPYMAVLGEDGEPAWQEKLYDGYGKRADIYYSVEGLHQGVICKVAGGSGGNKYPQVFEVVEVTEDELVYTPMTTREWDNMSAELKQLAKDEPPLTTLEKLLVQRAALDAQIALLQNEEQGK